MSINREEIFDITNGHCFYCGKELDYFEDWHKEHVIPKSMGGGTKGNLVPSCRSCNIRKNCLSVEGFRKTIKNRLKKRLFSSIEILDPYAHYLKNEQFQEYVICIQTLKDLFENAEIQFYLDESVRKLEDHTWAKTIERLRTNSGRS